MKTLLMLGPEALRKGLRWARPGICPLLLMTACGSPVAPTLSVVIQGRVTSHEDGAPIGGMLVDLQGEPDPSSWRSTSLDTTRTDLDGHYEIKATLPGCIKFWLEVPGEVDPDYQVATMYFYPGVSAERFDGGLRCTEDVQIVNVNLLRKQP